jgi:hypothetical protein
MAGKQGWSMILEQALWDMPARLVISLNRPVYRGSLAMCVRHFRDQLSLVGQVTSHIALESGMVDGKSWLGPEEIHGLLDGLPA